MEEKIKRYVGVLVGNAPCSTPTLLFPSNTYDVHVSGANWEHSAPVVFAKHTAL